MKVVIEIDGENKIHILKKPKGVTLEIRQTTRNATYTTSRRTTVNKYHHMTNIDWNRRKGII